VEVTRSDHLGAADSLARSVVTTARTQWFALYSAQTCFTRDAFVTVASMSAPEHPVRRTAEKQGNRTAVAS